MKIVFVVPHYYPMIGGVESYVRTLAEGLKAEHDIVVITSGKRAETVKLHGVKVYRLPYSLTLSNTPIGLFWYLRLKRIIKHERPDIINAHSPVPYMADVVALAGRGTPLVVTYHSGSMVKGNGGLVDSILKLYERLLLPQLFKHARSIIAIDQEFVRKHADDGKRIDFVPPGIDTELFYPQSTQKAIDVTFVGRVELTSEWKGLDVLLKAIATVKVHRPKVSLQIVGDGDAVEKYKLLAKSLNIEGNVTFKGLLQGEQLADAYRRSRIVVLPSKTESESFGMVLAEAQACGVAVVGSRIGGIPNVIEEGKTGLLVPAAQPKALAKAILDLLTQDIQRVAYGKAGVKRARELFSHTRLIEETEKILVTAAKPQIVHVSSNYPPRLGGLENVVRELATEQHNKGSNVRVVTSRLGFFEDYKDSVPVKRLSAVEVAHTPLMPALLLELLKIKKGDVVHVHVAQAFVPEIVGLASRIKRFRYIAHVHLDIAPSGPVGWLLKVYKPLFLGPMLRRAVYVVVFTKEQQELMVKKYRLKNERVVIVPNGVAKEFYYLTPRTLHKQPRLLFVGRLSLQKNLPLLLNALNGVSERFDTRIVGDGELREEYESLARKLNLKNVHFYGRKDGDELHKQYQEADIFVLPSEREGMPLVLLEAMAKALPIIGTDVTGIRDVVANGRTGYLVPFGDESAFRAALIEAIKDRESYSAMSQTTLKEARQYSWSKVAQRFERLYEA